jgi:hypothetical protein
VIPLAERSRTRSIGRIEKHIHELSAAIDVWGSTACMTDEEQSVVKTTMHALIDTLWARKKADDAKRPEVF